MAIVLAAAMLLPEGAVCAKPDAAQTISSEWGGYLRATGTLSYPDNASIYQFNDDAPSTFFDRQGELRIKNRLRTASHWTLETHYELVGRKGDTLGQNNHLRRILPDRTVEGLAPRQRISDRRRLMNLTRIISEGDDYVVYHRLDRLNLTYNAAKASVRFGRQALTWGNGLLFNPVDLFNPFSPTAIDRDYKIGDDMAHLQLPMDRGEVQLLYLPRRDPSTGEVENDQSSFAGKYRQSTDKIELDLMAARHYGDTVLGVGLSGYLGGAAWRSDLMYTALSGDVSHDHYWQFVINMDYAWQWAGKNIYGLMEFYYNGLGEDNDYDRALADPSISERIERGELFTLGRIYLAGQLQIELHPLLHAHLTLIVNPMDPSGIVQPQLVWDVLTNLQLILGAGFAWGADDTEFGGFDVDVAGATVKVSPAKSRYLWLTYYF